jgi:F0F1-type ATP synthase delta subunit
VKEMLAIREKAKQLHQEESWERMLASFLRCFQGKEKIREALERVLVRNEPLETNKKKQKKGK